MAMMILVLLLIASASAAVITGWVIDNECWQQTDHIGFDNAKLDTAPQDHTVKCLLLKICKDSGFFLRDNVTGTLTNVGAFDSDGNAKMVAFLETLKSSQQDVYVTVDADVTGTGESAAITNVVSIAAKASPAPKSSASVFLLSPLVLFLALANRML